MSTSIISEKKATGIKKSPVPSNKTINSLTTFEAKAEEMKVFLKRNPIPKELLKKA